MVGKETTKEDYLRAIYHLEEENSQPVKSIDLASYMKVSKPSVSEMLRKLSDDGFVKFEAYSPMHLTAKGRKEAKAITFKHRVIEMFLSKMLKLDYQMIHDEAHKLEHAFSDVSIKRLHSLLGSPKHCPHGKPIPTAR